MRTIPLLFTSVLAALLAPCLAFAADAGKTTINAILVVGSNEHVATDPRLAPYEANLKRMLHYESFRYVGEGSTSVAGGGTGTLTLPNNNRLELQAEKSDGHAVRVKVHFGSTDVVLSPGKTVVVVGATGDKGEASAVIVTAN